MTRISRVLHLALRPTFAVCLFLSQFTATRTSFFTANPYLVGIGVALVAAAVWLWLSASRHLQRAQRRDAVADTGPFQYVRHPIYASIYVLSVGLGLVFFAWAWFLVLVVFAPLWYLECRREEADMLDRYGETFAAYRRQTKMLIPGVV